VGDIVRRGTKDRPRYYVRYVDLDGKRKQRAAHQPTKALAERYLAEVEGRIARGLIGIPEPTPAERARQSVTIRALYEKFIAEYAPPTVKDVHDYRLQTKAVFNVRILPTLGERAAASISRGEVERLRDRLAADGYAAGSIRWTLSRLSRIYTWAQRHGLTDCTNPVSGVELPAPVSALDYFSKAEVAALLAHTGGMLHAMAAFCVFTGARKGEAFGARWQDVDFNAGRVTIARSYELLPKSGKVRHVPLHPELARIIREWNKACPTTADALVFPVEAAPGRYRMGNSRDDLDLTPALEAAGCHLPAKPWHALRHSFASHAIMAGASLYDVQRLLGHATPAMTAIYAHLSPDHLAAQVARLDFAAPPAGVTDLGEVRRQRAAASEMDNRRG
jgi:integrase